MAAVHPPLLVIVGPTAVGKTALSLALAQRYSGEIVSADSRHFYRGMDIGTAKPTVAERNVVPHHFIDMCNPDETVTLGQYQDAAYATIDAIHARERLPILVGGTGQYVHAVVEGWGIPRVPPQPALRMELEAVDSAELIHPTGQSGHPYHAHYDDMIDVYLEGEYVPMPFSADAVAARGVEMLILQPATE